MEKMTLGEFKDILKQLPFIKRAIMNGKEKELKEAIEEHLSEIESEK